jgi:hypothetical protein
VTTNASATSPPSPPSCALTRLWTGCRRIGERSGEHDRPG